MNPAMYLTSCARFDKLLCQCITMTNTWEDVTWEEEHSLKEWVVEYIAKVSEDSTHHLTVIHGSDMEDVQKQLMLELRTTYMLHVQRHIHALSLVSENEIDGLTVSENVVLEGLDLLLVSINGDKHQEFRCFIHEILVKTC